MWSVDFANSTDVSKILDVQRKAFRENQKNYQVFLPALEETLEHIAEEVAMNKVLVARQGEGVLGALRINVPHQGKCAEVYYLAVDPAYAHLAVGRSLMTRAEAEAISKGVDEMRAEVGLRDAPAVEFYYKMGYRPYELRADGEIDWVVFGKTFS